MTPRARLRACLVLFLPYVAGCATTTFDGRVFQNADLSFRLTAVPPQWRQLESDDALLAFRDDGAPASIELNGRCGKDGDDVPLEALTHHLFLQFTDRTVESSTAVKLDGREALHTELSATLDGVPEHFVVFVLKKNGCVYDFIHVSPPSSSPESRRRFVDFVQGFSTISP